jgi:hypothetical protein
MMQIFGYPPLETMKEMQEVLPNSSEDKTAIILSNAKTTNPTALLLLSKKYFLSYKAHCTLWS